MRLRWRSVAGTAVLASLLWLSPFASASRGPGAGEASPTGAAGVAEPVDPGGSTGEVDAAAVAAAVEERAGDRFGGYWVDREAGDGVVHVNVVQPTAAEHRAAEQRAGGGGRVEVHDVDRSYGQLVAARDAVAASLDPGATGDFAVGLDVPRNGLTVETERGDVDVTRLVSLAAIRQQALADPDAPSEPEPEPDAGPGPDAGAGADAEPEPDVDPDAEPEPDVDPDAAPGPAPADTESPDQPPSPDTGSSSGSGRPVGPEGTLDPAAVDVVTGADIAVEPLDETPTTFPPYEAGLHLSVASGTVMMHCTSSFSFSGAWGVFGSTAGHCGREGDDVHVGETAVDTIALNTYQDATRVEADAALYSLSGRRWAHQPVLHADGAHRPVAGALADSQIGPGLRLCFDGRTSGAGKCGTVTTTGAVVCCDSGRRSFVFSCISHDALPGDSGGPVYQPLAAGDVRAAGILSSSVTLGEERSMCFSTVDRVEAVTGTRLLATGDG